MKKVMFALCFMFGGVVVVNAQQDQQDTTSNQYRTETQSQYPQDAMSQDQNRERIQATELPDEVKRTLEGEDYRGWLISGAFKSTGSADQTGMESDTTSTGAANEPGINATGVEGEEIYIVELKNGAETKTLRFGSNGQQLEGMEEGQNSPNSQFDQNDQLNQDQMNQSDQLNQNDRMNQADPNEQSQMEQDATRPSQTPETPGQTPGDQSTDQATQPQPDQSTETQPQTDQSSQRP